MNKYYKKLELDKILELLAEQTVSDSCREKALNIKPQTDFEAVTRELKKPTTRSLCLRNLELPRFVKSRTFRVV